jgi:hypothetical protein
MFNPLEAVPFARVRVREFIEQLGQDRIADGDAINVQILGVECD